MDNRIRPFECLWVEMKGVYTTDRARIFMEQAVKTTPKWLRERVLVDLRDTEPKAKLTEMALLSLDMHEYGVSPTDKVALVCQEGEHMHELFVHTAQKDGHAVKFFTTIGDAVEWLREE